MSLHLIGRDVWGAKPPGPDRPPQDVKQIREFFIHWPGSDPPTWENVNTPDEECATMRAIQAFHMGPQRGWEDIGYSWGVFQSGRIYIGRGMDWVPAAQLGHNTHTCAAVAFIGPHDKPSGRLETALHALAKHADNRAGRRLTVRPHRAVNSTECPGNDLARLAGIINGRGKT